ncbi:MAG TPA: response regulator [Ohtaekwangia sp.]|nr:response regulator [Ohtaekwangia sp.]
MEKEILIIDDDADDCMLVKESLQQVGWKQAIHHVLGGREALDLLSARKTEGTLPTVVILDLNMPQIGGMEVLTAIRNMGIQVPVVLYTTTCSDDMVTKAKSLGAYDCVKKGTSYADNLRFASRILSLANEGSRMS